MSPNTTRKGAVTQVGQDDDAALAVRASKGEAAAFGLLDDQLLERAEQSALRAALAKLTPLQQEVVVLRFLEGFSTQEIAKIVGKREGTVRGIQFRAIGALRQLIPSREAL